MSYNVDIDRLMDSLVSIIDDDNNSIGTGFFIRKDGYVITCHHVIYIQNRIRFKYKQKIYRAEYVKDLSRPNLDIAILKAEVSCEKIVGVIYEPKKNEKCDLLGFSGNKSDIYVLGQVIRENNVIKDVGISVISTFEESISNFKKSVISENEWNVYPDLDAIFKSYSVNYKVDKGFSGGMMVGCESGKVFGVIQSTRDEETRGIRINDLEDVFKALGVDLEKVDDIRIALHDYLVYRKNEYKDIKDKVLDKGNAVDQNVVVLQGFGGYGKTVLANCICNDDDVRRAFNDGIYVEVVGPDKINDESICSIIKKIIKKITGEEEESFDYYYLQDKLINLIGDKYILLVLDDVWSGVQLLPFIKECKNCVRLITTRDKKIYHEFRKNVTVDGMKQEEAYDLLTHKMDIDISDNEKILLERICERVGYWPQLISLLSGRLNSRIEIHKQKLVEAIKALETSLDEKGITALDPRQDSDISRNNAIRSCIEVSLQGMKDDKKRLYEIAIINDNSEVPLELISMIWNETAQMSYVDTEELCSEFYNKSFINSLDLDRGFVGMHQNMLWYLRSTMNDSGCDLKMVNNALIDGLHKKYNNNILTILDDDVDIWNNIISYYVDSDRADEARCLLIDYSWISRKIKILGIYKLLEDYGRIEKDGAIEKIFDALYLSASTISKYPDQLSYQLWGRLKYYDDIEIKDFLDDVEVEMERKNIRMLFPSLTPPNQEKYNISGHQDAINDSIYCLLENNHSIITCSDDNTAKIWDAKYGYLRYPLERHTEGVSHATCTNDGYYIFTASKDNSVNIYNVLSGEIKKITKHYDVINSIKLSYDNKFLITGSSDGSSYVWSVEECELLCQLDDGVISVNDIDLTTNSKIAVTVSSDKMGRVWNVNSGELIGLLEGHEDSVNKVVITNDDSKIITVSDDCTTRVWSMANNKEILKIKEHTAPINYIDCDTSGDKIVTSSDDLTAVLYDIKKDELIHVFSEHIYPVKVSRFLNNDEFVVTASGDNNLCIWNVENGKINLLLQGHIAGIKNISISEDEKEIVSASDDMTSRVWKIKRYMCPKRLSYYHTATINHVLFSKSGKIIISSSNDNIVKVWNASDGEIICEINEYAYPAKAMALSNDENILATAFINNIIDVRFIDDQHNVVIRCEESVRSLSLSNNSKKMVVTFSDNIVRVYSVYTGRVENAFEDHEGIVNTASFSLNDKQILTSSNDGTVRIFEIEKKKYSIALFGCEECLISATYSRNGNNIMILTNDASLRIIDSKTGFEILYIQLSKEIDEKVKNVFVVNAGILLDPMCIYVFLRYGYDDNEYFWKAMVYDLDGKCVLSTKQRAEYLESAYMVNNKSYKFVCSVKTKIMYCDLENDCLIESLCLDYDISCLAQCNDLVAAGDAYGRIHICKIN